MRGNRLSQKRFLGPGGDLLRREIAHMRRNKYKKESKKRKVLP